MKQFGPYDIVRELGRGAMGVVHLAIHRNLQRECALKTIAKKIKDPHAAERFVLEGQAVAKLGKHPNIVQVFDAGIIDQTPYIAMEFVEGETLDSLAEKNGPLKETDLIELGRKIALALDHAHRRGIVHRDVKPANIIIDREGEPQLLDFGIAKDVNTASAATKISQPAIPSAEIRPSVSTVAEFKNDATCITTDIAATPSTVGDTIQGTPAFMAPEQADPRRGPVDARSDVYSLGSTLYTLVTGRRPFEADTLTALLVLVVTEPPANPGSFVEISSDLEAIILKSLEKDPNARYQTALEFADDLSRVSMGLPTRALKLGTMGRLFKRVRTHRRLVGIAAAFVVFIGLAFGYFLFRSREIQALWMDIAERTARSTAQQVEALLDPALPMLEECAALAESGLLPVDDQEELARHLVARFRYQSKLSWLSYGDALGRFTGAWRDKTGRIVIHRSWLDEQGGHVRETYADGDRERIRWNDEWTYDPRKRPFYQLAADATAPIWTKPYEWFAGEGMGITSALALRYEDTRKLRGVFTADYHLGALADFLANLKLGKRGRAYLLGREGDLLASPERGAIVADSLLAAAVQHANKQISGGLLKLPFDEPNSFSFHHEGTAYVAAVEAFEPADGLPIVTVVLVPEDDITGPVKAAAIHSARIAGGVTFFAILVSVLMGILQKRRLFKDLSRRKRRASKAPTGTWSEKTEITNRDSETQSVS